MILVQFWGENAIPDDGIFVEVRTHCCHVEKGRHLRVFKGK